MDLIRSRIKVKSLNFMRGRTFLNKYLIIDEAEPDAQADEDASRAPARHQVICLGNIAQIDTPYLTEGSSGLTFVVDRFGLAARGPRHAAARRALAAGGLRGRRALTWRSVWQKAP